MIYGKKKKKILKKFNPITFRLGNWADSQYYPRVLKNEGFILECVRINKYNLIEIKGDIDTNLTQITVAKSKIFIEVKNRLSVYTKDELYKFFNYLREFDLEIIPVVIARKIFERPKELLIEYNGAFIEMEKILVIFLEFIKQTIDFEFFIDQMINLIEDQREEGYWKDIMNSIIMDQNSLFLKILLLKILSNFNTFK